MGLVLQPAETRTDSRTRGVELTELGRPGDLRDIADLGLTLPEAKRLLARVQQAVVAMQARDHAARRPDCASCGGRCRIRDRRSRRVATPFGEATVRLPRFRCPGGACARRYARRVGTAHSTSGQTGASQPIIERLTAGGKSTLPRAPDSPIFASQTGHLQDSGV